MSFVTFSVQLEKIVGALSLPALFASNPGCPLSL